MERTAETYWGRFTVSPGVSTAGGAQNVMLRAVDKKAARVSNFQLPAAAFGEVEIEQIKFADAWRDNAGLEVDATLASGEIVTLTIRRSN